MMSLGCNAHNELIDSIYLIYSTQFINGYIGIRIMFYYKKQLVSQYEGPVSL